MEQSEKIKKLAELFKIIREETIPIEGHTDPGALEDCWDEARDIINELYVDLMTGLEIVKRSRWTWIVNHDFSKEKMDVFKKMIEEKYHGSIGKYLFFSESQEELIELAKELVVKHDLRKAKTPSYLSYGFDKFVLCVYDTRPNLLEEMKQYATDTIEYRHWKSDEATMKGVEQSEL